jgi:probable rRNA maturation factor
MPPPRSSLLFEVPAPGIPRLDLRRFARRLASDVAGGRGFNCLIASDAELRRLNREFRKKDYATDVLSFPSAESNGFAGEIAISYDRARAQAAGLGHSVDQETRVLMLHGLLHLLGFDHETDRGRMARNERRWRQALGLPPGLIERSRIERSRIERSRIERSRIERSRP